MPVITTLVGSKIALGVVALIALGGAGLTLAAAADTLPEPLVTESPAPTDDPIDDGIDDESDDGDDTDETDEGDDGAGSGKAGGPDATGPAGFGLCTAYLAGGLATVSTAYDSLSAAAGEDGIDSFCETVIADKKGESGEESDDSAEKSGATNGKSGVSDTEHGKPADKPGKPTKPTTSNNGGGGGGHGNGNANGHNKHNKH